MRAGVAVLGIAGVVCGVGAAPASATPCPPTTLYVAAGDSLTAGLQPDLGEDRRGGFTGVVRRYLAEDGPVTFRNVSCSGETTTTFVQGGRCEYTHGSQLATAEKLLRGHRGPTVITLSVGANDVQKCATPSGIDMACVQAGLTAVSTTMPVLLRAMRKASPQAKIVVLNYYNPILAYWGLGEAGQAMATASAQLATTLNTAIDTSAAAVNASTADVAAAFVSDVFDPAPSGVPHNVETVCAWTWACSKKDIHPNDDGYRVLGSTAVEALMALDD